MAGAHRTLRGDLSELANQFAVWRRSRAPGARIPEWLWEWAVEVATQRGVSRTAAALKLRYNDLKRRVGGKGASIGLRQDRIGTVDFVELNPGSPASPCDCTIEFEKTDGARLRIELKGSLPDLERLARGFWESA